MTRKRNDNHSTEFGLWLREQAELDSYFGYRAYNIDYVWRNKKTGEWIFIEEKRYQGKMSPDQKGTFKVVHEHTKKEVKHTADGKYYKNDTITKYQGFHLIVFEKTSPEDGRIWLDNKEISKEELLHFLKNFEKVKEPAH